MKCRGNRIESSVGNQCVTKYTRQSIRVVVSSGVAATPAVDWLVGSVTINLRGRREKSVQHMYF